jgi:hypothetical protein
MLPLNRSKAAPHSFLDKKKEGSNSTAQKNSAFNDSFTDLFESNIGVALLWWVSTEL